MGAYTAKDYYHFLNVFQSGMKMPEVYLGSEEMVKTYALIHESKCSINDFWGENILFRWYKIIRNYDDKQFAELAGKRLIVSMTSYPARIEAVPESLKTILNQTRKADLVLLWLAKEQFPEGESLFPEELKKMINDRNVIIKWCDKDIKPHKKYLYAMLEYPDDLIVTVDDDLYYNEDMLENLYLSYLEYPDAVSALRTHLIAMDEDDHILPYSEWIKGMNSLLNMPSMELFATGGAGTLYPPGTIKKEFLDPGLVERLCPIADDLWMKVAEVLNQVPVVQACPFDYLRYVDGTQEVGLVHENVGSNKNDDQIQKIREWAEALYGAGCIEKGIVNSNRDDCFYGTYKVFRNALPLKAENNRLRSELKESNIKKKELVEEIQRNAEKYKKFETELKEKNNHFIDEININKNKVKDLGGKLKEARDLADRYKTENEELKKQIGKLLREIEELKDSQTYKVGRVVTYLPRKLKGEVKNE